MRAFNVGSQIGSAILAHVYLEQFEPDECKPNAVSSACCSRGTKCCEVKHLSMDELKPKQTRQ